MSSEDSAARRKASKDLAEAGIQTLGPFFAELLRSKARMTEDPKQRERYEQIAQASDLVAKHSKEVVRLGETAWDYAQTAKKRRGK